MQQAATIICVMGPTASGKTALAMRLAEHIPCEIVNVDSAQVYQGMDIGTAKPDAAMRQQIPHHLLDIVDPRESYSAGQFCKDANVAITEILARGHVPLLVGGTMLYFRALQFGLATLPSANSALRAKLTTELATLGLPALYQRLQQLDAIAAARINSNDQQRIQRALELYELTGQTPTQLYANQPQHDLPYQVLNIGLIPNDRQLLHDQIALRFEQMLEQGLVDEVQKLHSRADLHHDLPAIRSVGYRQVWQYLEAQISLTEMREQAIFATRQLAKRQLTWLRSWPDLMAVDSQKSNYLNKILAFCRKLMI